MLSAEHTARGLGDGLPWAGGGGHCWHSAHLPSQGGLTWAEFPASPSSSPHRSPGFMAAVHAPARPYHWNLFSSTRHIYLGQYHCGVVFKRRFDSVRPCPTLCAVQPHLGSLAHTPGSHIPTRWQVAVDPHRERSTVTHRSLQPLGPQRKWLWRKHVTLLMKLFLGHPTLCFTLNTSSHLWNSTSSVPVNSSPKD